MRRRPAGTPYKYLTEKWNQMSTAGAYLVKVRVGINNSDRKSGKGCQRLPNSIILTAEDVPCQHYVPSHFQWKPKTALKGGSNGCGDHLHKTNRGAWTDELFEGVWGPRLKHPQKSNPWYIWAIWSERWEMSWLIKRQWHWQRQSKIILKTLQKISPRDLWPLRLAEIMTQTATLPCLQFLQFILWQFLFIEKIACLDQLKSVPVVHLFWCQSMFI